MTDTKSQSNKFYAVNMTIISATDSYKAARVEQRFCSEKDLVKTITKAIVGVLEDVLKEAIDQRDSANERLAKENNEITQEEFEIGKDQLKNIEQIVHDWSSIFIEGMSLNDLLTEIKEKAMDKGDVTKAYRDWFHLPPGDLILDEPFSSYDFHYFFSYHEITLDGKPSELIIYEH